MEKFLGFIDLTEKYKLLISLGITMTFLGMAMYPALLWIVDMQIDKAVDYVDTASKYPKGSLERDNLALMLQTRADLLFAVVSFTKFMTLFLLVGGLTLVVIGWRMWPKAKLVGMKWN